MRVHDLARERRRFNLVEYTGTNPLLERAKLRSSGIANGFRAADGRFDYDDFGPSWFMFDEPDDTVFWRRRPNEKATLNGRAFALDERLIDNAATYAFDGILHIYATVDRWLLSRWSGIVVLDWTRAFDRLRDVPRIGLDPEIQDIYWEHMKPARMPKVFMRREKPQEQS